MALNLLQVPLIRQNRICVEPNVFIRYCRHIVGRDSSVVIATRYEVDGPGIETRWGARIPAPVQTVPGAHPVSCTIDTGYLPRG